MIAQYRTKVKIECEGEETEFFVAIPFEVRISGGMPVVETGTPVYAADVAQGDRAPFPLWDITSGQTMAALDRAMIRQGKAASEFNREEQAIRDEEDTLERLGA